MLNSKNLNKTHSIYILISLDTIQENKSLKYLEQINQVIDEIFKYEIPIFVITPDSNILLEKIQKFYNNKIHFISDNSMDYFTNNNLIKTKNVFGKNYEVISLNIRVYSDSICIYEAKRINKKTIIMAYIKAFENYLEKIKKNI